MKGRSSFIFIPQRRRVRRGARSARKMIQWIIFSESGTAGHGQAAARLLPLSFFGREALPNRKMMFPNERKLLLPFIRGLSKILFDNPKREGFFLLFFVQILYFGCPQFFCML